MSIQDDLDQINQKILDNKDFVLYRDVGTIPNADMDDNLIQVARLGEASLDAAQISVTAADDAHSTIVTVQGIADSVEGKDIIAANAAIAAEAARDISVSAKDLSVSSKDTAVTARDEAVSAKNLTLPAKDEAVTARNQAVAAKDTAVGAASTATTKAGEASQSASDAEYWAGQSGEVTSVQGKKGVVVLEKADFPWMGSAAERNVGTGSGNVMEVGAFGLGSAPSVFSGPDMNEGFPQKTAFFKWTTNATNTPTEDGSGLYIARTDGLLDGHRLLFGYEQNRAWLQARKQSVDEFLPAVELHTTGNLLAATQAEIDAGTQTAPRLFSPKQLQDKFPSSFKNKLTITESQTISRPTMGSMVVILYGGGGGSGASMGGGSGGVVCIHVASGGLLPDEIEIVVGASAAYNLKAGSTTFLSFAAGGGYGGNAVGNIGAPGEVVTQYDGILPITAKGEDGRPNGGVLPDFGPLFPNPYEYGKGGKPIAGEFAGKPGIAVIYY